MKGPVPYHVHKHRESSGHYRAFAETALLQYPKTPHAGIVRGFCCGIETQNPVACQTLSKKYLVGISNDYVLSLATSIEWYEENTNRPKATI